MLHAWCRELIKSLITVTAVRFGIANRDPEMLTGRALRWLEMYLPRTTRQFIAG